MFSGFFFYWFCFVEIFFFGDCIFVVNVILVWGVIFIESKCNWIFKKLFIGWMGYGDRDGESE